MQVLLAGASGFLGQALGRSLAQQGHQVVRLVRSDTHASDEARWDPEHGEVDCRRAPLGCWTFPCSLMGISSRSTGQQHCARQTGQLGQPPHVELVAGSVAVEVSVSTPHRSTGPLATWWASVTSHAA